jgi:ketosteroid isomerase-like protein
MQWTLSRETPTKNGLSAKDFAEKFLDPWNAHDKQAVLAGFADDFEWQFSSPGPFEPDMPGIVEWFARNPPKDTGT